MKDGYYWATPIYAKRRVIVEVKDEDVSMMGDDRNYKVNEFTDYRRVIKEIPNPENITIEEPKE